MEELSIKRINESAPYIVCKGRGNMYRFYSDEGVHYAVDFLPDEMITKGDSHQLVIANLNNKKSPRDAKVRDSILAIIDEFFRINQSTLLYLCETGDGKQSMRSRLFEYWFNTYKRKTQFTLLTTSIVDDEGIVNFATLIIRNDNPNFLDILSEFSESVKLLSQKPE